MSNKIETRANIVVTIPIVREKKEKGSWSWGKGRNFFLFVKLVKTREEKERKKLVLYNHQLAAPKPRAVAASDLLWGSARCSRGVSPLGWVREGSYPSRGEAAAAKPFHRGHCCLLPPSTSDWVLWEL